MYVCASYLNVSPLGGKILQRKGVRILIANIGNQRSLKCADVQKSKLFGNTLCLITGCFCTARELIGDIGLAEVVTCHWTGRSTVVRYLIGEMEFNRWLHVSSLWNGSVVR